MEQSLEPALLQALILKLEQIRKRALDLQALVKEQLIMFLFLELPLLLEFVQAVILTLLQSLMPALVPPHLPGLFQLLMLGGGLLESLVLKFFLEDLSPQSSQAPQ
jgi:hypothetical protein